jgi:uncharacterized protein
MMNKKIGRREFLKAAPAAASLFAYGNRTVTTVHADESHLTASLPSSNPVLSGTSYEPVSDYPIHAKAFSEVMVNDSFWKPKIRTNAVVTIPFEIQKFHERGQPIGYNVLQAAIYSLQTSPDPALQQEVNASIAAIETSHAGVISNKNDLFEVAAAYYTATGNRALLDISIQSADSIYNIYKTTNPPFSGGERDAINCIQLYRVTHDKKYLDLAKHYLDIRGLPNSVGKSRHNQSHIPVLDQSEAVGHAVNDASLMVSLVDLGTLTGIKDYSDAADRIWTDTVSKKMYVTGGIGSTGNEGFGRPYSLPNLSAYSETCASIMFSTFNHKMFLSTGDGKYIDVMERTMYNSLVDGVSASGDHFFYVNRLASSGDGRDLRWQRASLECCPPNLVRFLASMAGYIYAQKKDSIYVNLYVSSNASFKIADTKVKLSVDSEIPWGGKSQITVSTEKQVEGTIKLRIPGWARNQAVPSDLYFYQDQVKQRVTIAINGKEQIVDVDQSGYVSLSRQWMNGDIVDVHFPMEVRRVAAKPQVREDQGKLAVERGPIVYCSEWPDYEGGRVLTLLFDPKDELVSAFDKNLYGGVVIINSQAKSITQPMSKPKPVKLIPYYLWANRGAGEMTVWLSNREYSIGDVGPAGGWIFYINPDYLSDGWRYLEAAPRDQSAGAKWGCFRTLIPGAQGTAIGKGRQNTLDMGAACSIAGSAADLCASYSLNGFRDWFLPSIDELTQMYSNLQVTGVCNFNEGSVLDNRNYWSSSQVTTDMARHLDFADNGLRDHFDDKDYPRRVRAIRAF